jgi:PPOX class probable F420-dependent enzyme
VTGLAVPDTHRELLERPLLAHLATIRPDGTPQTNPVWFRWAGGKVELSQIVGSAKLRNMRANPAVSLSIVDPSNPFRFVEIRGRVVEIAPDSEGVFVDALAQHYTGRPANAALLAGDRVCVRIEPVRFVRELGHNS